MAKPVIAILMDAVEPGILERFIAAGRLPNLARLHAQSARSPVHAIHPLTSDLATHAFLTASHPGKAKYWGGFGYDAAAMQPLYRRSDDYGTVRPFYDYSTALNVCQFDLPKAGLARVAQGLQVLNWGALSAMTEEVSNPPGLYSELIARYGPHPARRFGHPEPWQHAMLSAIFPALIEGVRLRTAIHRDLLARSPWDIFLVCYSELHSSRHCFAENDARHLAVAEAIDASIGDLLEHAGADASVAIFSLHGTEDNSWDILSSAILPEFLHRIAFPSRATPQTATAALADATLSGSQFWSEGVWRSLMRGAALPDLTQDINFIPATWYQRDWPQMPAFALISFDEGMVRLNVQGRDRGGKVPAENYEAVLAIYARAIASLSDPQTGLRLAVRFTRTRSNPLDDGAHLPAADLIVEWDRRFCTAAQTPITGLIGPLPRRRHGGHWREGFAWVRDPRRAPGVRAAAGAFDIGPTLLDLAGAPIPAHCDGISLLRVLPARTATGMFPVFMPNMGTIAGPKTLTGMDLRPVAIQNRP